jgi:uncharacterized membrane protein
MTTNLTDKVKDTASSGGKKGASASSPLQDAVQKLVGTVAERALTSVSSKVLSTSGRLNEYAEGGGGGLLAAVTGSEKLAEGESPVKSAAAGATQFVKDKASDLKEAITGGGGGGGKGKKLKLTNIIEEIDVGVPVQLAYDQWTQFTDFPQFMKKLEQVEQVSDEKLEWKAKVFWSRRTWESTIIEQVPAERIIWRSKGDKGYIDGAVTFHELTPDLTRILVVLEYHPKGLFEKTGNIWRAQGRRVRLELKHFRRHVMTQTVLHPDEIEGWPGEIRDSQVVEPGESEEEEPDDTGRDEAEADEFDFDEDELEAEESEPEEPEPEESDADDTEQDEVEEEPEPEPEEEEAPPPKRRARRRSAAPAGKKQGATR